MANNYPNGIPTKGYEVRIDKRKPFPVVSTLTEARRIAKKALRDDPKAKFAYIFRFVKPMDVKGRRDPVYLVEAFQRSNMPFMAIPEKHPKKPSKRVQRISPRTGKQRVRGKR